MVIGERLKNLMVIQTGGQSFSGNNGPQKGGIYDLNTKKYHFGPISGRIEVIDDFFIIHSEGKKSFLIRDIYGNKSIELEGNHYSVLADRVGPYDGFKNLKELSRVRHKNGLYGYSVNKKDFVIKPKFTMAKNFSDNLAAVQLTDDYGNSKWGYIDEKGETVIPFQFSNEPGDFSNGLALVHPSDPVSMGFESAFINKKGEIEIKLPLFLMNSESSKFVYDAIIPTVKSKLKSNFSSSGVYMIGRDGSIANLEEDIKKSSDKVVRVRIRDYNPERSEDVFVVSIVQSGGNNPLILFSLKEVLLFSGIFQKLGRYDADSGLCKAEFKNSDGSVTKGYVNKKGEFTIVIAKKQSGW